MSAKRTKSQAGYQLGPGMWTLIEYRVFDAEGEAVEDQTSELGLVFGYGAILPALEAALQGTAAGTRRTVSLSQEDAYGRRKPEATVEVDRDEFPPDAQAGDRFEAETEDGRLVVLRLLEVTPEVVIIDQNHPLAGQRVRFELFVREVRPARPEELEQAEQRLSAQEGPDSSEQAASPPLISPQSLLQGPSRRYEKGPAREPGEAGESGTAADPDPEPGNGD